MTLPQRFNADYETALFQSKEAPPVINQSLEFLILYLEKAPLYTIKKYSNEFLKHVEEVSGNKPQLVSTGPFENWWGRLENVTYERKVNSKEMSAFHIEDAQVISQMQELKLYPSEKYLAKPLSEMSGRGFCVFDSHNLNDLEEMLKRTSPVIVEPFLERKFDFSHYVLPGRSICYENIVDSHFQYKGTTFRNLKDPSIESLSFYELVSKEEWLNFQRSFNDIKDFYARERVTDMYSMDSFIFSENGILKVRALTEVNVRKTMGYVAWKLSEIFAMNSGWSQLLLARNKGKMSFSEIKEKTQSTGCLYLSPGDTRFEIFFLKADSEDSGKMKLAELKRLLPDTEFPV